MTKPRPSRRPPNPAELQRQLNAAEDARQRAVTAGREYIAADSAAARNAATLKLIQAAAELDQATDTEGQMAAIASSLYAVGAMTDSIAHMMAEMAAMRRRIAALESRLPGNHTTDTDI